MKPITYKLRVLGNIFGLFTSISGLFTIAVYYFAYKDEGVGSVFLFIFGLIALFIPIFGCIVFIKFSPTMMWMYAAIMFILVIGKLDLLITVLTTKNLNAQLEEHLEDVIRKNRGEMDIAQKAYQCCGLSGPGDYKDLGLELPQSCFWYDENNNKILNKKGCRKDMVKVIKSFVTTIVITSWINFSCEVVTAFICGLIVVMSCQDEA